MYIHSHVHTYIAILCLVISDDLCKYYLYVGPPKSPTIKVEDIRLGSFTISWTVIPADVNNACGPVSYRVTRLSGADDHVIDFTSMTNITYSGLRRHKTTYTVVVVPYNMAGRGIPANITVTTIGQTMCMYTQ